MNFNELLSQPRPQSPQPLRHGDPENKFFLFVNNPPESEIHQGLKLFILFQLEKQQKKLEAKGILVEIQQLRQEWEAARNGGKGGNNEPILEHEIDVVGDDSDNDNEEEESSERSELSPTQSQKSLNAAFSIDNLLASRYQLDEKHVPTPHVPNSPIKEENPQ